MAAGLSTLLATSPIPLGNLLATPASVGLAKGGGAGGFVLDGDYSDAHPSGAPTPTYPFVNEGDTITVIFRQPYEQAIVSYVPLDLTKGMPGITNAYPLGDINFKDGGSGVWQFERTFGNIPGTRVRRGQSHTYAFQYVLNSGVKISGAVI